MKIPAGVDEGDRVRLSGEGEPGVNGGPPGDLYVQVHIKPHPVMLSTALERAAAATGRELRADRSFMIGDTAGDLQLAEAFGARGIWCAWGYVRASELKQPPARSAQHPSELYGNVAQELR